MNMLVRPGSTEPIFNVPTVLIGLIGAMIVIHVGREFLLTTDQDLELLVRFAFIPARYSEAFGNSGAFPGGLGADVWTFFTYSLLHADFMHLGVNSVWLLPFGTAVARRFGTARFLVLFAVTAAAGAAAHLLTHGGEIFPMIGASAAVSGMMAASMRFAFARGGPIEVWRRHDPQSYFIPAAPLLVALRTPMVFIFLVTWFGMNFVFGIGSTMVPGSQEIAWQAHVGGFLAGLFLFPLFDPIGAARHDDGAAA
ncbi:MAG: rhomboid family intramembrane serine protease [Xanthobacteraceae bacterium]